ncbi:MAG: hypothetical protein ACOYXT_12660 [Bacteroidota bacterium]
MKKIIALIITAFAAWSADAQDIKTSSLNWTAGELTDLKTGKTKAYSGVFETSSEQSVVWKQKAATTTFQVTGMEGSWTDVKTDGKVIFQVDSEGITGTLTLERSSSGTFVTLDLDLGSGSTMKHRYRIEKVE